MILNVYLYTQKLFITSPFSKSNRPASATATSDAMVSQPRPHGLGGLEDEGEIESTRNVDLNQLGMWFVAPKIFFWINIFGGIWTPSTYDKMRQTATPV